MDRSEPAPSPPRLRVAGITKSFPGVRALQSVDLEVAAGQVLGLVGENGAGKSTLMKILAGIERPDSGQIFWEGSPLQLTGPAEALQLGIALIHQELNLAENLTIAQNIWLGREPHRWGLLRDPSVLSQTDRLIKQLGLTLPATTPVGRLSIAQRQLVEIAKAVSANARLLIMDEPTSSLTVSETERLFHTITQLQQQGVAVIYISHRLGEIVTLADRVEVLRDGCNAGRLEGTEITHDAMVHRMVGRQLQQFFPHQVHPAGEVQLEVERLRVDGRPDCELSLQVGAGQIVGLAGLVGAGRTELLECLMGLRKRLSGEVRVEGKAVAANAPRASIDAGLAMVPEDRRHQGLVIGMSVSDNLTLASLPRRARAGWLGRRADTQAAARQAAALRIKTPHLGQLVQLLSGGNQQKVVFGKWLLTEPKVLLLDEPTRGVDIGAKQEIYRLMEKLAADGSAILFVSSDLEEIMGMADQVLVMHEGRLAGQLPRASLSEHAIMQLAVGGAA